MRKDERIASIPCPCFGCGAGKDWCARLGFRSVSREAWHAPHLPPSLGRTRAEEGRERGEGRARAEQRAPGTPDEKTTGSSGPDSALLTPLSALAAPLDDAYWAAPRPYERLSIYHSSHLTTFISPPFPSLRHRPL